MKSSKLFVSSLLVSTLALAGCATATGESDEVTGEAAGEVVVNAYEAAWSPYGTVPNAFALASPAVAAFQDRLYMSHLDSAAGGLYWSSFGGDHWADPQPLAGYQSSFCPAMAAWGNHLNLAYVDSRTSNIHVAAYDGFQWGVAVDTRLAATAAPAMAHFNNRAYLFNLSAANEIVYSTCSGSCSAWSPFVGTGLYSQSIPAVAVHGDRMHLLHQGVYSSRLEWATFDGVAWAAQDGFLTNRLSYGTPSLGVYGDQLHFMYRSLTGNRIVWGAYGESGWSDFGVLPTTAFGAYGAPGLATVSDRFFMVSPVGEHHPIDFYQYQPVAF